MTFAPLWMIEACIALAAVSGAVAGYSLSIRRSMTGYTQSVTECPTEFQPLFDEDAHG